MATIRSPVWKADLPSAVSPLEIVLNRSLLLLMGAIVGVVQSELLHGREMALDPIQPRCGCRREVEVDAVRRRIGQDLGLQMKARIIQDQVQHLRTAVSTPQPFQEGQEGHMV